MRLQRSAGNRAVAGLLQRKFGFEVETNIGLRSIADATFVKRNQPGWVKNKETRRTTITAHPETNADDSVATGAPGFVIKVDHHRGHGVTDESLKDWDLLNAVQLPTASGSQVNSALEYDEPTHDALRGPIAEFVTEPPIDEFSASEVDVRNAMTAMGAAAIGLKSVPLRDGLATHYSGTVKPGVRVGVKGKQSSIGDLQKQVAIQTTVGVQLEHVEQYLREQSKSPAITDPGPGRVWEAQGNVNEFIEALAVQNGRRVMSELGVDAAAYPEATGAMTLISQYLLATHYAPALGYGWGKNKVGMFFYKSKLSSLFSLSGSELAGYKNALLTVNRANSTAKIAGTITAGVWLDEVLAGTNDRVFEGLKNPYSSALGPEQIGPPSAEKLAVVVEKRKGGPPLAPGTTWSSSEMETDPNAWGTLGVLVYRYLRRLHHA